MLKQIDTKDDLEVLAKFFFGVDINCCLFNAIPRRLLKMCTILNSGAGWLSEVA